MTSLWRHLSLTSISYDWRRELETGLRLTTD